MNTFYKDKPLFGLDIGSKSLKVMQLDCNAKIPRVIGYGVADINPAAVKEGVIVDPETIAQDAAVLFKQGLEGDITTRRVAMSVPVSRTYNRAIKLPALSRRELDEAVRMEAEQYIPVPMDNLYLDYQVIRTDKKETELFVVAAPKAIVDSYLLLARLLGLEVVAMETTISSAARLFAYTEKSSVPTVLIDFGSNSVDVTIFDKTLVVTGTVGGGGEHFIERIASQLGITNQEARIIKAKYGLNLSKKQREIKTALNPVLEQLIKEIRRMVRYYEERFGDKHRINQIVTMGGGATMPGLAGYLTDMLRLPVRSYDPWQRFSLKHMKAPSLENRSVFVSVAGLALLNPKELFV